MDAVVQFLFLISSVFFLGLLAYLVKALRDSYKKPKSKYDVWTGWLDADEIELMKDEADLEKVKKNYMIGWNRGRRDAQRYLGEARDDE